LARNYTRWAADTTPKSGPVARWASSGITKFVTHPIDAIGGRPILVTGVVEPTLLASSGDILSLEDEFLDMVVDYATHRVQVKQGGKSFADSSAYITSFWHILKERSRIRGMVMPKYWILTNASQ
jgi:hypothetical protein